MGTTVGWGREAGLWEAEDRHCTGDLCFHWGEIPSEPNARQATLLWPLPLSLDFSPLHQPDATWQPGEQVLPCSQENVLDRVENPASVGSCGCWGAACLRVVC